MGWWDSGPEEDKVEEAAFVGAIALVVTWRRREGIERAVPRSMLADMMNGTKYVFGIAAVKIPAHSAHHRHHFLSLSKTAV